MCFMAANVKYVYANACFCVKLLLQMGKEHFLCGCEFFRPYFCIAYCILHVFYVEAEHGVVHVLAVVAEIAAGAVARGINFKAALQLCGIVAFEAER